MSEMAGKQMYFLSKSDVEVFIAKSTSVFLTNLGLPPSDKRKYMEKIQDKALTASAWI